VKSAAAAVAASDLPVLKSLQTDRGTRWGRLQPHLNAIAEVALAPATTKAAAGILGSLAWLPYPELPRRRRMPLWIEGITPLFAGGPGDDDGIPIGILFTRDAERFWPFQAQIVAIPREPLPFTAAARVVVDLPVDDDEELGLADAYRAVSGLPTTAEATASDLIAAEGRAVLVEDKVWVRSHHGEPLSKRIFDLPPMGTRNGPAVEAMRTAHARTFVEKLPYELHPDDVVYAEDNGIALLSKTMLWRTLVKGPYVALAALDCLQSGAEK
jgi:hypothetical protein